MKLEFSFQADVVVGDVQNLGVTPYGERRIIPILGGLFKGSNIEGEVLSGGADWQIVRNDGVIDLTARYLLQTHDGVLITVVNRALRYGPEEVMRKLSNGEAVNPSAYYFRGTPTFEVADEKYKWLNEYIFVCTGERHPEHVSLKFYKVL